jgi:hypothetical protein
MARKKVDGEASTVAEDPKNPGYDMMGQPLGSQSIESIGEIPDIPEDENPLDIPSPLEPVAPTPTPGVQDEFERRLVAGLENPAVTQAVGDAITKNPSLRSRFGIEAGVGPPAGEYRRDYEREPALAVTGGREVGHPPGYTPDPPAYVTKYLGQTPGTKTDYRDLSEVAEDRKEVANVAALDAKGEPIKTDEYKLWIDEQVAGGRLSGEVRTNIALGAFVAEDGGVVG